MCCDLHFWEIHDLDADHFTDYLHAVDSQLKAEVTVNKLLSGLLILRSVHKVPIRLNGFISGTKLL